MTAAEKGGGRAGEARKGGQREGADSGQHGPHAGVFAPAPRTLLDQAAVRLGLGKVKDHKAGLALGQGLDHGLEDLGVGLVGRRLAALLDVPAKDVLARRRASLLQRENNVLVRLLELQRIVQRQELVADVNARLGGEGGGWGQGQSGGEARARLPAGGEGRKGLASGRRLGLGGAAWAAKNCAAVLAGPAETPLQGTGERTDAPFCSTRGKRGSPWGKNNIYVFFLSGQSALTFAVSSLSLPS